MDEETEIEEPIYAEAWVHLWEAIEPVKVSVSFCGHSFKHMAQVLVGDAHPKKIAFIVFGDIDPPIPNKAGFVIDCEGLDPIFEFGHELSGLR
jgi:hypothetical protein